MKTGKILKLLRQARGVSQSDLAKSLNISREYLSAIENDKKQAGFSLLNTISNYYNIPLPLLLIEEVKEHKAIYQEMNSILGKLLVLDLKLKDS